MSSESYRLHIRVLDYLYRLPLRLWLLIHWLRVGVRAVAAGRHAPDTTVAFNRRPSVEQFVGKHDSNKLYHNDTPCCLWMPSLSALYTVGLVSMSKWSQQTCFAFLILQVGQQQINHSTTSIIVITFNQSFSRLIASTHYETEKGEETDRQTDKNSQWHKQRNVPTLSQLVQKSIMQCIMRDWQWTQCYSHTCLLYRLHDVGSCSW